jgi:ABC-type glycerol-3-phosphate transport system permease component
MFSSEYARQSSGRGRIVLGFLFFLLFVVSLVVMVPFTVYRTAVVSSSSDYERQSSLHRLLYSRADRFLRTLCGYFPPAHRSSIRQMRSFFPTLPPEWQTWEQIARDRARSDAWALSELASLDVPATLEHYRRMARDYGEYARSCDLGEAVLAYDQRYVGAFLRNKYGSMSTLCRAWGIPMEQFATVEAGSWSGEPIDERTYVPLDTPYYRDLLEFRKEYRDGRHAGFARTEFCSADFLRPAALAYVWEEYAGRALNLTNQYAALHALPFPVPISAAADHWQAWQRFVQEGFPLRHIGFLPTPTLCDNFARLLESRYHTVTNLNRVVRNEFPNWKDVANWSDVELRGEILKPPFGRLWMEFLTTKVSFDEWVQRDTLPEVGFQALALKKYGTLPEVNTAYGLNLKRIEELRIPFREAALVTFHDQEKIMVWQRFSTSYHAVVAFFYLQSRAVFQLEVLLLLALLVNLSINAWAGYVLARRTASPLRKGLVFVTAALAFPALVTQIPSFLLMQELGVAQTLVALALPLAANMVAILFLSRKFRQLPESVWNSIAGKRGVAGVRLFWRAAWAHAWGLLIVCVVGLVLAAHHGWAWSLVVSRDPAIWTMAAWTKQFTISATNMTVTALSVLGVNALPVFLWFALGWQCCLRTRRG